MAQSTANFPPSLNLAEGKASAIQQSDGQFLRFRSDNSTYQSADTVRIEIPCGRKGLWGYGQDTFLEFKSTAGNSTCAGGALFLDGNAYSYFKTARLYHGTNLLCNIPEFGRICHAMYDAQVSIAERNSIGTISLGVGGKQATGAVAAGIDDYENILASGAGLFGHNIDNGCTYSYAFPLMMPLIGSLTSKAVPLGWMTSSLYLELVVEDVNKVYTSRFGDSLSGSAGSLTAAPTIANFTLKDIYLNMKCSQINPMYDEILLSAFNGRKILIPSVDFKGEMKSIAAGGSSFSDKFSFQLSSVKFLWWWIVNTQTANGTIGNGTTGNNFNYNSAITQRMMGVLNSYNLSFNGVNFPTVPISASASGLTIKSNGAAANFQLGATCYQHLLRTLNQNSDYTAGGGISKALYVNNLTTCASDAKSKRFIGAVDLDRFDNNNDRYMQGYNSTNQSVVLQVNWDSALSEACNLYAFVQHDVSYELIDGLLYVNN